MDIKTERLTIRAITESDTKVLAALLDNEKIKETYMVPDYEDTAQYLRLAERFRELSRDDSRFVGGIYLDHELIGFLNDVEIRDGSIELGYALNPAHWGRGYATEALRGVTAYLLDHGFRRVVAGAFEENTASIRVMISSGMRPVERTDEIEYRGKTHRCVYFVAE